MSYRNDIVSLIEGAERGPGPVGLCSSLYLMFLDFFTDKGYRLSQESWRKAAGLETEYFSAGQLPK